ncbi:hypothetical protein SHKM778_45760 [Streptomyces sp. KM77-8]|uniref:Uncharacterized protein n=1 Tax=Streptomyces haneummycinicus TaxID=3074435 RepID=A0AAT9HM29_9ACTN
MGDDAVHGGRQVLVLAQHLAGCGGGLALPIGIADQDAAAGDEVPVGSIEGGQETAEGMGGTDAEHCIEALARRELRGVLVVKYESLFDSQIGRLLPGLGQGLG